MIDLFQYFPNLLDMALPEVQVLWPGMYTSHVKLYFCSYLIYAHEKTWKFDLKLCGRPKKTFLSDVNKPNNGTIMLIIWWLQFLYTPLNLFSEVVAYILQVSTLNLIPINSYCKRCIAFAMKCYHFCAICLYCAYSK